MSSMGRPRNFLSRLGTADAVDWAYAALFFALGLLVATLIFIVGS